MWKAKAYLYKSWKVHRSSSYCLMKLSMKLYTTWCWPPVLYNEKAGLPLPVDPDPHLTQCSMAHMSPCANSSRGPYNATSWCIHYDYTNLLEWLQQSLRGSREHRIPRLVYVRRRRYVVCPSDELVRDGFKQIAAIICRFNNPISRKTRLSLARVTFKPFRSTFTIGKW